MAPNYPDEIDVFTVPHSRMKQLVHKYLDLVSSTNFRDARNMTSVLEMLCHTFHVFKAHEQIENRFIMRRLKEKLTALDINDAAVCNCHSDNRLTEMISMVLEGYRWAQRSESERVKYGRRLRHALEDFTQVFIPHMKEEEEVFQPMLIEYFTYDELKELKDKVIQQHLQKMEEADGDEKCVPECDSDKEDDEEVEISPVEQLPTEVMVNILSHLSPRDLCRCAQVSQRWNQLAMDPSLWPAIYPVQWAAGDWSFHPYVDEEEEGAKQEEGEEYCYLDDEDADRDESSDSELSDSQEDGVLQRALREVCVVTGLVKHILPRVGPGVELAHLSHSRGISSSLVHKILKLCPNLRVLKLAHTKISDSAFKEYGMKGGPCQLEHLDLSSCENITDSTLHSLAGSHHPLSTSQSHQAGTGHCTNRANHSTLAVVAWPSSDPEPILPENNPIIEQDLSFTDVPLDLCSLDCLDICIERNPASGTVNLQFRDSQTTDDFTDCSVKRTCCSSESRGCKTGCYGREGGEGESSVEQGRGEGREEEAHSLHRLTHLSLNSCYRVTDHGLRALSERGGLPLLQYLDLSGCLNATGEGVASLVDTCQSLDHAFLFYCDNVYPDPFPATASGCRNLECGTRFCCRSGD